MNDYYPQQYFNPYGQSPYMVTYAPTQYTPQWIEAIPTVVVGVMFVILMFGMLRDLFTGKEVKLPF